MQGIVKIRDAETNREETHCCWNLGCWWELLMGWGIGIVFVTSCLLMEWMEQLHFSTLEPVNIPEDVSIVPSGLEVYRGL
jgi:hypothetical protein